MGHGLQAAPWEQQEAGDPHAHLRRAAGFFAWSQTEPGHGCPISMTYAAVPALRADDAIAKEWTPLLAARSYDPGVRARSTKTGALAGMGMTEKQGGSDVRANRTRAVPTTASESGPRAWSPHLRQPGPGERPARRTTSGIRSAGRWRCTRRSWRHECGCI